MKPFNFATIVAAAGIAQVAAVPLLVISSNNIAPASPRFGHAVAGKPEFVAKMKSPCRANRYRQKAVEISNLFREALGLPLIKSSGHHGDNNDGRIRILPFVGTPNAFASVSVHGKDADGNIISIDTPDDGRHHRGNHGHGRHRHHNGHHLGKGSFFNRIQFSIMNLGRWEGRAVAFVLGCGIGVLLRMLFVLTIIMYRAVKGRRGGEEQHEYSQITIIEEFVDSTNSSPPTYVDEKVPIVDEPVQAPKSPLPSYVNENYPIVLEAPSTPEESK